ncbi:MAG: hypothetical protein DMD96_25255 [Candidatus Rokuibacteriota bacterium]|nr:MAG: hypothetical protein DMD96_25255 [Candidatus Rokubacteria bacterium]
MVTMRTFVTMRTLLIAAMSGLAVLIVGCSTAPFVGYKNGPVTLYIGDVRHVCAASGNNNRGCTVRYPNGRIEVYCADGDYECLAHELRHVADPTWQHDHDQRSVSAR